MNGGLSLGVLLNMQDRNGNRQQIPLTAWAVPRTSGGPPGHLVSLLSLEALKVWPQDQVYMMEERKNLLLCMVVGFDGPFQVVRN